MQYALLTLANVHQFDADAVAKELGYKDGKIVKTRWSQVKIKKLSGGSPAAGVKKRTPSKKAVKAMEGAEGADDDEDAATPATPTKTPKKRTPKPKKKAAAEAEDEVMKEEGEDAGGMEDVAEA